MAHRLPSGPRVCRAAVRYDSIQLLRAVAALMVVVLHTHIPFGPEEKAQLLWWPAFSDLGWLGVDLFFVISGFIIAHVLSRPDVSLRDYFWRRFWRIYPIYWLVMLAGLYFHYRWNWFGYAYDTLGPEGMVKSFLIFPLEDHPFWEPGWSLEHEVIFYIIAALVAPFLGLRVLAVVMIGLAVTGWLVDFGWDYHLFARPQLLFGAGVCAYLARERSWKQALPVALAGLALCYAYHYSLLEPPQWLADTATAAGFAGLVVACLDWERKGWRVPRIMIAIGNASFSLYLLHWLVIPFAGRYAYALGGPPELWRWIIVGVSIALAMLSFRLVEQPINRFAHRPFMRRAAVPAE